MWQVENWPIENVKPYSANPRVCPPEAIKKVAESIRKFGWRGAILVDAAGEIIAGHTRLKAGQALGYTTVPVVVARDLTPEHTMAEALRRSEHRYQQLFENAPVVIASLDHHGRIVAVAGVAHVLHGR